MQRGMGGRGVGTGQKVRERHQIRTFSALASHYTGGALCWLLRTSTNARMLISSPVEGFLVNAWFYILCTKIISKSNVHFLYFNNVLRMSIFDEVYILYLAKICIYLKIIFLFKIEFCIKIALRIYIYCK